MKYYLITLFVLISLGASAQQISYSDWKKQALDDIRLLPEYGHKQKTKEQIEADNQLIAESLTQDGTHRKASDHLIQLGFKYLYQGDLKTAMYRFNQAYLLDAKNENIYWGYGAIYGYLGDQTASIEQYDKGLAINANNANILTDKATIYFVSYQQEQGKDHKKLDTAISLLQKAYKTDPKNVNTTYKLSICNFLNHDCTNAWRYFKECEALGGKPITTDYTAALKKQCNN
jgi:tetratricopeptide (TPR) repeat protein